MPGKVIHIEKIIGLSEEEVRQKQLLYGKNVFELERSRHFLIILRDILREPMVLLLTSACVLYFILGEVQEGILMIMAMTIVVAISIYQEVRSSIAIRALKQYTEPRVSVIREGIEKMISTEELVPGDIIVLDEGNKIPADARIVKENDLTVNESVITGESMPVEKSEEEGHHFLYQGSTINSGKCMATVTATGNKTVLGKLGKSISTYTVPKTLLQQQFGQFIKRFAFFGFTAFLVVWTVNYLKSGDLIASLLFGLTLAMAVIPEEIPVAFSSFMALGAYHMSKLGIISRQPQIIENLGAVSVICLDKTGTITENKMQVKSVYDHTLDTQVEIDDHIKLKNADVLYYAVLASEADPFDSMEKAILEAYQQHSNEDRPAPLAMVYEYNLQGIPPMMTHVYQSNNINIVASKGAAERIVRICHLDKETEDRIYHLIGQMASKGYRVIGVASAIHANAELPVLQDDFNWKFEGLLSLYDPPKKNVNIVLNQFYRAGISVKLLTGDHPETALNIAEQVGIFTQTKYVVGEAVMNMGKEELQQLVEHTHIYARMFPEAKLKVIEALKANGEIVAMTGDGVNDGPALKSSNIGIAMGKHGTEIARQASDLILTDDKLEKVTEAIRQGRKIFSNLKKAIRYIISIHIPIIFTASVPLLLGWKYPNIFTPVHIIFLELIMGPTCSIFFEKEPVEENMMLLPPRKRDTSIFTTGEILVSIVQGLIISGAVLILYYFFMNSGHTLEETRTIVFSTLILSNIFLTFANRSFTENIFKTLRYKNSLVPVIIITSVLFLCSLLLLPAVRNTFGLTMITAMDFMLCLGVSFASVMWFELYKTNLKEIR